jgi:hypothetical protein
MSSWEFKNEVTDKAMKAYSDRILEYDDVIGPDGTPHRIPFSEWNPNGKDGAGYYMPGADGPQKATPVK